jgi:hypothetical protein
MREVRRASATRGEIRDATVAASVAVGEAAIPHLMRARAFDCRSVALSPGDCENSQTPPAILHSPQTLAVELWWPRHNAEVKEQQAATSRASAALASDA